MLNIIWKYFTIENSLQKEIEKFKRNESYKRRNDLITYYKYGYIV